MEATAQPRVLIDVILPDIRSQPRVKRLAVDAALVFGFAILVALCAQIAFKIPTTTVPITGQTFGVLLTGGALGSKRGGLSMFVYMILGMASLPIFAPSISPLGDGQAVHFILPWSGSEGLVWSMTSGGYIVGFVAASYVVGMLAERGWDRRATIPFAMLIGNIIIYLIGLPWLAVHIASKESLYSYFQSQGGANVLDMTLRGGLYPFIGGDAVKLIAAALILPGAWALVDRLKGASTRD